MGPTQHQSSPLYPEFSITCDRPYSNYYHHSSGCSSSSSSTTATDHYTHRSGKASFITSADAPKNRRLSKPRRSAHSQSPPERLLLGDISSLTAASATATTRTAAQKPSMYYFTWLVFLKEKWVPFDAVNQTKLEQTLTLGGTFVDVTDTHFPKVKRVRVFPRNNYLSYLGVKYRLSRIMQPDAWLDYEARENDNNYSLMAD